MANEIINTDDVRGNVIILRGQQVILDRGVASLYGVETRVINRQ